MMKLYKYVTRFLLFLIIGVIIAAVVIPFVFEDEIVASIKKELNHNINAKVDFKDVDISMFSSFPNARISISGLSIVGIDDFKDISLAKISRSSLVISLPSILDKSKPLEVLQVSIDGPDLNIVTNKNGKANYEITKSSNNSKMEGDFVMKLKKYEITNGKLTYRDIGTGQYIKVEDLNHSGSGKFYNQQFELMTISDMRNVSIKNKGTDYFSNGRVKMDAIVAVDLATNTYTLKDNSMSINDLDLKLNGFIALEEAAIKMDLSFDAPQEDTRGILSIVPGFYSANIKDVANSGDVSFDGKVQGMYNGDREIYPKLTFNTKITNGSISYPSLSKTIDNLNMNASVSANQGNYKDLVIDIPQFDMRIGGNELSGALTTTNVSADPHIKGHLKGDISLADWKNSIPMETIQELSGLVTSDINFEGKKSDIENKNYQNLVFEGKFEGKDIRLQSKNEPLITIKTFTSEVNAKSLTLESNSINAGRSDLSTIVVVQNPLSYLVNGEKIQTSIQSSSNMLDINEWISKTPESEGKSNTTPFHSDVDIDMKAKTFLYDSYEVRDASFNGSLTNDNLIISNLDGHLGGSDFKLKGKLNNLTAFANNTAELQGNLDLTSDKMILEDFMSKETSDQEGYATIPDNVNIEVKPYVKTIKYDKITLRNVDGNISIADQQVVLQDGTARGLGGTIKFSGLYGTPTGEKPDFSIKYDLSNLDFEKTFSSVELTQSFAPIMKFITGHFNSTLVMSGKLNESLFPDLATLDASGFLETLSGKLESIDIANTLADKLGIDELRKLDLDHTKNWFDVVDGMIELKPFTKKIAGIDMSIAGKHGLEKGMSYNITMNIPRKLLKKNLVTSTAEKGLSMLEREAAKLGVNINQGDFIKIRVDLTGSLNSPKIKIAPLSSGGKATVKDIIKDELEDIKNTVRDSVKTVIEGTKKVITDSVNSTIETAKDTVNTIIDETVEKVTDSIKSEIDTKVNEQIDKVLKDSSVTEIKDEVEEIIKTNTGKTVEDIKDKINDWNPFKKKKK